MRDPPRPGLESVSPALAGRLSTTAPPGKPPQVPFPAEETETQVKAVIANIDRRPTMCKAWFKALSVYQFI